MTDGQGAALASFYDLEEQLVAELGAAGWSQTKALKMIGLSSATWYYRHHPRAKATDPTPHTARTGCTWLTDQETLLIISELMAAFEAKKSVFQAYYEALDAARPVASLSSWHRLAAKYLDPLRPVRPRRNRRSSAMPQWDADAPMQVWSWDITILPGPYRGQNYHFYVVLDVFSRKIVGWRVEDHERDELAKDMFERAFTAEAGQPHTVHSDRGASMSSLSLAGLFTLLGIDRSRNRPRVSNDNPFSESAFKTAKHGRFDYPQFFCDLDQARTWATAFVHTYNHEHRHSSLEGHNPASIHDGSWVQIHQHRQAVLDQLYTENPRRYPRRPTLKTPMAHTTLNQPKKPDRLQTG